MLKQTKKTRKTRRNEGARSQAAVEYIMLLGGVLVVVVLIMILMRSTVFAPAGEEIGNKSEVIRNLTQNLSG